MQCFLKQLFFVGSLAALGTSMACAADDQWKLITGVDYSTGDYGGDPIDTDITYVPVTGSYRSGAWTFKATVPWVRIDGSGRVIGAGDGGVVVGDPDEDLGRVDESGLGDVWFGATYSVEAIPADWFYLDVGAKVKAPTADEDKGLGTGETDYTLQMDIFKPLGALTPMATVAYKIKGDAEDVNLDDVFYVSVGSDLALSEDVHVGASFDYQEAASEGADDALELFAYSNIKLTREWGLMLYAYKGLEDGSPDYGGGVQVSYRF